MSSLKGIWCNGAEIVLPFTVGVTPGVSVEDAEDEAVSGEEELTDVVTTLLAAVPISLRGIDLAVEPESPLACVEICC